MIELAASVIREADQTTIRISGYLSSENAESLERTSREIFEK